MNVYSLKEFQTCFYPELSTRTIERNFKAGNYASRFSFNKVGNSWVIIDGCNTTEEIEKLQIAVTAVKCHHKTEKPPTELISAMAIKYKIDYKLLLSFF